MSFNVSQAPAPVYVPPFTTVTIAIDSKVKLASLLGALVAYGTGTTYAENALKGIGLGDFYSGNVAEDAREMALAIAAASNVVPLPEFSAYVKKAKQSGRRKSKAGAAVRGTADDRAPGREETHFEPAFEPVA